MNVITTIKKLHEKFPKLTVEELIDILDCYVEEPILKLNSDSWTTLPKVWYDNKVTSITSPEVTTKAFN